MAAAMMGGSEASEYANAGQSNNFGLRRRAMLGGPPDWQISKLRVDSVGVVGVVVVNVFAQQAMQVPFVYDDHVAFERRALRLTRTAATFASELDAEAGVE